MVGSATIIRNELHIFSWKFITVQQEDFMTVFCVLCVLGNEDEMETSECLPSASWTCPTPCKCSDGIADCRNKKLTHIPSHFPADTTEM